MKRRHLQIRLVKDVDVDETQPALPAELPFLEIEEVVHQIFVGIGALMILNTVSKILVNKLN